MTLLRLAAVALLALLVPSVGAAAVIVSPPSQAVVAAGSILTVTVGPSAGEVLTEASVATLLETADAVAGAQAGTFDAQIRVPLGAAGPTLIAAVAKLATGRMSLAYVQILADPGSLQELVVSGPRVLSSVGQIGALTVKGLYSDGVTRNVPLAEQGTAYRSTNPAVLAVDSAGHIQARARGTAQVVVTNTHVVSGLTSTAGIAVRCDLPDPPVNHIPNVVTNPDRTVAPEALVQLDASGSTDQDQDAMRFLWQQESGRAVVMRAADTATPYFIAPRVTTTETLEFTVVVSDSKGATTLPKSVRVTVQP